jgi:glycyl-tRNA synthetase beta chain
MTEAGQELLLELRCEEIPARMQARAAEELKSLVTAKLAEAGLKHGAARTFAGPRRLTLVVEGLPARQPDVTEEKKGPKLGAPDQALQGFMKANGLSAIEEAEVRETDKGSFYFLVRQVAGRETKTVLPEIILAAIGELSWPKSMRWRRSSFRWVRPLHEVLAVFAGEALEGALDLGGESIAFGAETVGHRFMSSGGLSVTDFEDYAAKLQKAFVLLDPETRRTRILEQAEALTKAEGLVPREDPALLDEVVGLVEWPIVLMGRIEESSMELPPEVLTTAMRAHQKYFAVETEDGRLAPRFLVAANIETQDQGTAIVAGNERVLRARLADAGFFWDQDRKQPLEMRVPALQDVVFHAKLGSLHHKVDRIELLASEIAGHLEGADREMARRAARLAKADLMTGMVGEFPELQGVMGRYYALAEGEPDAVATAIAEHYAPLGPSDRCPRAPVSLAVSLADKLDTLTGFFAIGERPTGSKDPYALRRAGLGVIRLILENRLRISLRALIERAYELQPENAQTEWREEIALSSANEPSQQVVRDRAASPSEEIADALLEFFADRLKVALRDQGVRHDLIAAVFAVRDAQGRAEDDLVRLIERVRALEGFLESEDGANLLVAYRRAANIVRIEEKKDGKVYSGAADRDALEAEAERALAEALARTDQAVAKALGGEDFVAAMAAMAELRQPVDRFFDEVKVNAEQPDLRVNRLRLLKQIRATLEKVADFSEVEG